MTLKQALYLFCKNNDLDDLSCILHLTLLNSVANLSTQQDNVSLSPDVIDGFSGIGIDKSFELLTFLSEKSDLIQKYFKFKCLNKQDEISFSRNESDIDDEDNIEIIGCYACDKTHSYSLKDETLYQVGFNVKREKFIEEMKLTNDEIVKELVVLNTNEEHMEKLADILISKLNLKKEEKVKAKTGMLKYLHSIKKFTGVIADISGDAATVTRSIKEIAEDASGFSSVKDLFKDLID